MLFFNDSCPHCKKKVVNTAALWKHLTFHYLKTDSLTFIFLEIFYVKLYAYFKNIYIYGFRKKMDLLLLSVKFLKETYPNIIVIFYNTYLHV